MYKIAKLKKKKVISHSQHGTDPKNICWQLNS